MILYIIRHAIAAQSVESHTAGTADGDSLRPLTDEGRQKMKQIAQGLRKLGVKIDLLLTSPYLRAIQTSRIIEDEFGLRKEEFILCEHLSPGGNPEELIQEINESHGEVENIALVGHEPSLSSLISTLVSGDPTLSLTMKKGGVCRLSVERLEYDRCATLDWLLWPAQLVEIGG